MSHWKVVASLFLGSLLLWAVQADEPLFAVVLSVPFAFVVNQQLVHGAFKLPAALRWARFGKWQGQFLSFNDVHIRVEKGLRPIDHAILVVEDVERALNRNLGRFSREVVPEDGMLAGLRCVSSEILYTAVKPYEAGGASMDRLTANQFNRWLKATLIGPVELERERREIALRLTTQQEDV